METLPFNSWVMPIPSSIMAPLWTTSNCTKEIVPASECTADDVFLYILSEADAIVVPVQYLLL